MQACKMIVAEDGAGYCGLANLLCPLRHRYGMDVAIRLVFWYSCTPAVWSYHVRRVC